MTLLPGWEKEAWNEDGTPFLSDEPPEQVSSSPEVVTTAAPDLNDALSSAYEGRIYARDGVSLMKDA